LNFVTNCIAAIELSLCHSLVRSVQYSTEKGLITF